MGERSRAGRAVLGVAALALATGCGSAASVPQTRLPAPRTSASLTTTAPDDRPSPGSEEYVDPSLVEPPGGPPGREPVFAWSRRPGTSRPFGPVDAAELSRILDTGSPHTRVSGTDMALVLTPTRPGGAPAVARQVRRRLPDGDTRYAGTRDAVVVLGSSVVVRGVPGAVAKRSVHRLLSGFGGEVLVEGDRHGEGAIIADLSCRPTDPIRARAVADDLDAYATIPHYFFLRPPWAGPPLTPAERLARSTYVRFDAAVERATEDDAETAELWFRYRQALLASDTEEETLVGGLIAARRHELAPHRLGDPYDRPTLVRLHAEPSGVDGHREWGAAAGRRMGQLALTKRHGEPMPAHGLETAASPVLLADRLDDRLDVSGFLPDWHLAPSLAAFALYLDRAGCTDIRYRLLDWDEVRVD